VVVLGLTLWLIRSFIVPLIWAAIFAIANWQIYRRCAQHLPDALRVHVLPLVFSVLITLLVLGPVGGLQSFDLLGIFLGPVIVAVGKAVFDEWLTYARPVSSNTDVANAEAGTSFPPA
jgi:predicted PurR-regulated permease PerM